MSSAFVHLWFYPSPVPHQHSPLSRTAPLLPLLPLALGRSFRRGLGPGLGSGRGRRRARDHDLCRADHELAEGVARPQDFDNAPGGGVNGLDARHRLVARGVEPAACRGRKRGTVTNPAPRYGPDTSGPGAAEPQPRAPKL